MSNRKQSGKASELIIASQLLELGVGNVYLPVSDKGVDFVVECEGRLYSIQVKSMHGFNSIIGVSRITDYMIIHYKLEGKADVIFYLTGEQVKRHWLSSSRFKDLPLRKSDREKYKNQTLEKLVQMMKAV